MSQDEPSSKKSPQAHSRRRLKLRDLLFLLLIFSGIIPLLISSSLLISATREKLKTKETVLLTRSAQAFANGLSEDLAQRKNQLRQLGQGLLAAPGFATLDERLQDERLRDYLTSFVQDHPEIMVFHVANPGGIVLRSGPSLTAPIDVAMSRAFEQAVDTNATVYRFVIVSRQQDPGVVIAVPVTTEDSSEKLIVQILVRPSLQIATADSDDDIQVEELFLIDDGGKLLWSPGSRPELELVLLQSELVRDFAGRPISVTREYDLAVGGKVYPTLARVVPVQETGWGVVAHKPAEVAFAEVRSMVNSAVAAASILIVLALIFGLVAARLFSQPIQSLVSASHEIAAGNFDRRVRVKGLVGVELANLADDFNRMSEYVENYIEQLRKAAEANRELFISSIRAFAATIDAKDPYTRGHSERVATYSRAIARFLGLPKDVQERVWIAAVLHDVGKIGVDDRILKKGGVLTPEEFEQMKLHPV
ncbi:MAG: HAMP domain-containing protein, partial [bacterium]|nr:HAMP domain-containing protein [bacterium]